MHTTTKEPTRIENLISQKIQGLDFLQTHPLYCSTHDFSDIPNFLLSRIESLHECSLNTSVWSTHGYCKNLVTSAEKFVYCIFTQPPFLLADAFLSKLQTNVKMKFLFGKNSDIPECNDLVDKLQLNKPRISEKFEKRICDKVVSNVIVTDNGACLVMPDENGMIELMHSIIGQNSYFVEWCCDFFEHKWNSGEPLARLR